MKDTLKNPPGYLKDGPGRPPRRRRLFIWVLGITVLLLLSIIVSQQLWLWRFIPPDTASDTLLLYALSTLNFVAFVVFSFIFVRNLLKLRLERRERQPGSRIKSRLLFYFIAISFLPIIAMAVFSYLFLNRSLEKWFGRLPARVVNEAQEVQREAVDAQFRNLRDTASLLAVVLNPQSDGERQQTLDRVVAGGQISAVEIVDAGGAVITRSRGALPSAAAAEEVDGLLLKARTPGAADMASLADGKDFDVVSVKLADSRQLIVVPLRRASNDLSDTISGSEGEYQKLVARQRRVRRLGLSTLGLMTLVLLFVSSWVAIYLARGIVNPIKALAEASREVARGNLAHRVTTIAEDELALLADSFNQMTAQLEDNRASIEAGSAALREKNLTLEERRNYIETVLESLSTGVVSLNDNDAVTTINAAASRMLRMSSTSLNDNGRRPPKLADLIATDDYLVLDRVLRRARRTGQAAEQAQLSGSNEGASLPVALNATALGTATENRGVVLVIEDLSELLAAQRVAAWSEVARRMAHEIKNPLTPIQLSAERIAKSYRRAYPNGAQNGQNGTHADREKTVEALHVNAVINECTETIAREVAGLKAMVDEFSRFARLPLANLEAASLNEVIRQAVALYDGRLEEVTINTELDNDIPLAMLDNEQLRRVFVNLIDNANNALAGIEGDRVIDVRSRFDAARSLLIAEVSDNGHGIRPPDFKRLFQPYFSTRGSGTGLGLAIVQRIIMEHAGRIRAEVNYPRGARFVIELPSANAETGDGRPTTVRGN